MLTSLRAILRGAARSLGVERAANAAMIEEMWADVVGPFAAEHSRVRGVRGTTVLAEAEAGPWVQELSARRGGFIKEINRRLGSEVVTEIRFRQVAAFLSGPAGRKRSLRGGAASRSDPRRETGREDMADSPPLSPEEVTVVERAVSEIQDPEIREGAARAMMSQLRWRRRQQEAGDDPSGRRPIRQSGETPES